MLGVVDSLVMPGEVIRHMNAEAADLHHRCVIKMLGKGAHIDGGAGDDQLDITSLGFLELYSLAFPSLDKYWFGASNRSGFAITQAPWLAVFVAAGS